MAGASGQIPVPAVPRARATKIDTLLSSLYTGRRPVLTLGQSAVHWFRAGIIIHMAASPRPVVIGRAEGGNLTPGWYTSCKF